MTMTIKLVLADNHQLFREAVRALLSNTPDIQIVGEVGDAKDLLRIVADSAAEVVCMNVAMPHMNAAATTRLLLEANPRLSVIGLSEVTDWPSVRGIVKAGARGYMSKNVGFEELVMAIRTVAQSDREYFCPCVTGSITDAAFEKSRSLPAVPNLRGRELEIVRLIASGFTTPEIAHHLHLSAGTVRGYRSNIMRNLDLHSRTDLTRYAIRTGISSGHAAVSV
jgi:two-component system NarL family response regulator